MTDPSPSEILAAMVAEAGPDAVGEWRVRVPRPLSYTEVVTMAWQALSEARRKDTAALANLLASTHARHAMGACACRTSLTHVQRDPICESSETVAREIATPS